MTQTKFFRWTLLLCLSGATSPLAAQGVGEKAKKVEQMQVLKTDGKVLRITVDGKEQQIPWVINPSLRPDVFETSGEEVVFRSKIDTIRFNVAKEGCYEFVVVTHQGDSAMTRINGYRQILGRTLAGYVETLCRRIAFKEAGAVRYRRLGLYSQRSPSRYVFRVQTKRMV